MTVTTPAPRRILRGLLYWIVLAAIILAFAIVSVLATPSTDELAPRSPDSTAPRGAKAVVEVLRAQGVEVLTPVTVDEAQAAIGDGGVTTLLVDDLYDLLDADDREELSLAVDRVVLITPSAAALDDYRIPVTRIASDEAMEDVDELWGGVAVASAAPSECTDPIAARAATIDASATLYALDAGARGTECFPIGDRGAALVLTERDETAFAIVGTPGIFANESIVLAGNSALALGLTGIEPRLVWFQPALALGGEGQPSLSDLAPTWVTPVMLLAVAVTIAAAFWRGRRFGPLVIEPLPSVVKSDESMRGRARLYARHRSLLRMADSLRLGTIERSARLLGLAATSSVEDLATSAARAVGRPRAEILAILRDDVPGSERDLMRLSDRLLALEHDIARAIHNTGRMTP